MAGAHCDEGDDLLCATGEKVTTKPVRAVSSARMRFVLSNALVGLAGCFFGRALPCALLVALLTACLQGQRGDVQGEAQAELTADLILPPPMPLSAVDEQATFRLQKGFRLELLASEPLVQDPVCATCAPDGSVWVCEWPTYMRDVDATGELLKESRIVVLRDTDSDGRMDQRSVFLDGIVLPRAVLPLPGGALLIVPPQIVWVEDLDGDGRADRTTEIAKGFNAGLENPEHSGNGLLWGLDNRIHLANDRRIFRWSQQGFSIEQGAGGGQWGIAQDDRGRLFFNYNEDWLHADLVPGRYRARVIDQASFAGTNHSVVSDSSIWPIHKTPGINRGYREGMLKDGVLATRTSACAPHIARGSALGPARGDAFVCEPTGNIVRRFRFADHDGELTATNVYDRAEFLASTDERFRPVNLFALNDGSLGLVDMYRGVIQHKNYVTSYLRKQIVQRKLEQPTRMGRIFRIVADGEVSSARPLASKAAAELVLALSDPDGWQRDTAQRLLVLQQDRSVVPQLQQLLRTSPLPVTRMHAAAVLDGLAVLDGSDLRAMLNQDDVGVLTFALSHCAERLTAGDRGLWSQVELLARHPAKTVRWHVALLVGSVQGANAERALRLCVQMAVPMSADQILCDALVAAGNGREDLLVLSLVGEPQFVERGADLLRALAGESGREKDRTGPSRRLAMLAAAAACPQAWQQQALLMGLCAALPADPAQRAGFFVFTVTPPPLLQLLRSTDAGVVKLAQQVLSVIALRPDAGVEPLVDEASLPPEMRTFLAKGNAVFLSVCAACHQPDGRGMAGLAPPLRNSEWVTGAPEVLLRIALHGVRGPIEANAIRHDGEMPGQAYLSDADLAATTSWLRRAFGQNASPIEPAAVARIRAQHGNRIEPWTVQELRASH
ncbi:hypothetical protein LBMAG49_21830 [Planctomycetota bacterium]|nr:hypothetical protein LBMAG49_21830 [Planctomycetota bacterium]